MKIYLPSTRIGISALLFFVLLSNQILAQVPNCTTAMLPADGGTLANPSTPLTWNAPSGSVSGYKIYLGTTNAANELVNGATVTTTSYTYNGSLSCGSAYYWKVVPYNASGSAVGCSVQSFTILAAGNPALFPVGSWNAYCYNSTNWTNYTGFYTASGMDFDSRNSWNTSLSPSSASGYQGCSVPNDNHSVIYKRQGFTPGTYSLNILNDDACYLYLNGQLIYSKATWSSTFVNNVWTGNLDASSQLEFRWTEGSGGSNGAITFVTAIPSAFSAGSISGNQTLCPGSDPLAFTNTSAASGACGPVTYQWQEDLNCSGTWSDIAGATSATYDVPAGITQTTCYRRVAIDYNCNRREYSNSVTVSISSLQQGNPSVFPLNTWNGYVYDFTLTGYTSADDNWTDYKGYFVYPGVSASDPSFNTTNFYTVANVPSTGPSYAGCQAGGVLSGVQFKRKGFPAGVYQLDFNSDDAGFLYVNGSLVYSRAVCCNVVTNVWTGPLDENSTVEYHYKNSQGGALGSLKFNLVAPATLIGGTVSSSASSVICSGDTPPAFTSSSPASGGCTFAGYQWQSNTGTGWSDITGATGLTYAPSNVTVTTSYRRNITDVCGTGASSNILTLTVGTPALISNATFGDNKWNGYVFDFAATGYTTQDNNWTDYKGYFSFNSLSIASSSLYGNTTAPSYAPGYEGCQTGNTLNGVQFKRQGFPSGIYQIDLNSDDAAYLYVNGVLVLGRATCCTPVSNVWTGTLDENSKIDFRYKNSGGAGYGTLTLTLVSPSLIMDPGTIANNNSSTVCSGNSLPPFTSVANASGECYIFYQWEINTGTGWNEISGSTASTYAPSNITSSTSYRRKAINACGGSSAYSNVISVNVGPVSSVTPVFGNNVWNAYVYDFGSGNPTGNGTFVNTNTGWVNNSGTFQIAGISTANPGFNSNSVYSSSNPPSYATGYQGCQVGNTLNGVIFKRQGFTTGTYQIDFTSDDPGFLYVNGVLVSSRTGNGTNTNAWTGNLNASSTVEFRYKNNLGLGQGILTFTAVNSTAPLTPGVISSDQTVCQGATPAGFTVTTPATSGCYISYQWQSAASAAGPWSDISGAVNATYSSPSLTQTKYFRRLVADGCGGSDVSNIIVLNVNPLPSGTGTISGPSTFCPSQTGVAYSITDFSYATSYNWSLPAGASIVSGAGTSAVTVNFGASSGNISVTPVNSCGNGTAVTKAVTITALPAAAGTFTTSTSTVCGNQAGVIYTIAAVTGATSYNWTVPTGATITSASSNTNSITVTFGTNSGNVTVTPVNSCGNGTSRGLAVVVNSVPSAAGTISGLTGVCRGQTNVVYSIPAVTGATSYSWSIPSGVNVTSGAGTRSIIVTYTASSVSGTIKVTPVNTCGNGIASSISVIVSTSVPSAAGTITGPSSACAGTTGLVYSITSVSNATGYNWVIPSGATITSGLNTNSITVNLGSVSGNVTVAPTNACGSGAVSAAFPVSVNPLPATAGVISGSNSVCAGTIGLTYSIPASANATGYNWTVPSGAVITSGANTRSITVTMGAVSGNVAVTPTNACGNGTGNTVAVNVITQPLAAGTISGTDIVCKNTSGLIYSITPVTGATSYTWTVPAGAVVTSGAGTANITINVGISGGNISVTPVNSCFSGSASSKIISVTNAGPSAAGVISGPAAVCANIAGVTYSLTPVTGATSYVWTVPSGASVVAGQGSNSISVTFGNIPGNVSVTPVNVCGNGTSSSLAIGINPGPGTVGTISGASSVCRGQVNVPYSIAGVTNASTYVWTVPAGAEITSGYGSESILVSYENVTGTSGTVSVIASNNCATTSNSIGVSIDQGCHLTWTGSFNNDWSLAANWNQGFVPTKENDVTIPANNPHSPMLTKASFCKSLINNDTISIAVNTFNVYGDLANNGNIQSAPGSVIAMKGSVVQKFKGLPSVCGLTIDNASGVQVQSALTIKGRLLLVNGTLYSNGNVQIDIDNGGNIGYNPGDNGNVSGNLTVYRAIKSIKTHYFSCPLDNVAATDLADDAVVLGNGKTRLFKSNFNTQGWDGIMDMNTILSPNSAYSMFFPAQTVLDFTGSYSHNASYSTAQYSNAEKKYIFVGNPYPTTLDWDNQSGWTKNNINDAVYFWNPVVSGYASYISGFGTNSASQYIPAMNSFFVSTTGTGGTASLSINNHARVERKTSLWRIGAEQSIRLKIKSDNLSDETIIRWNDMATIDYDKLYDAYKMMNSGTTPNIYTVSNDIKYSINGLEDPYMYPVIPISVGIPVDGNYNISIVNSDPSLSYVLLDKKLGIQFPIEGQDYSFSALKSDASDRFELVMGSNVVTGVHQIKAVTDLNISSTTGGFNIYSTVDSERNANVEVFDLKGKMINVFKNVVLANGNNFLPLSVANGVYMVKVNVDNVSYADQITLVR